MNTYDRIGMAYNSVSERRERGWNMRKRKKPGGTFSNATKYIQYRKSMLTYRTSNQEY